MVTPAMRERMTMTARSSMRVKAEFEGLRVRARENPSTLMRAPPPREGEGFGADVGIADV